MLLRRSFMRIMGLLTITVQLESLGANVAGKIVLVRYGSSYRGIKAKLAEEHKAAALLIYSDPADDGYDAGDIYPTGPWRPMSGIQRGSILYTEIYPGDPLTPGIAATIDAPRISPSEARSLPRIPVMPINAQDAAAFSRILRARKCRGLGRADCRLPIMPGRASRRFISRLRWIISSGKFMT